VSAEALNHLGGLQARTKQTARYRYASHDGGQSDPLDEEDEMSINSQSSDKEEGQVDSVLEPKEGQVDLVLEPKEGQVDQPLEPKNE
jgi:hypothetical protein